MSTPREHIHADTARLVAGCLACLDEAARQIVNRTRTLQPPGDQPEDGGEHDLGCRAFSQPGTPVTAYIGGRAVLTFARTRDFICTQDTGHAGSHAACDGEGHILARWPRVTAEQYWQPGDCAGTATIPGTSTSTKIPLVHRAGPIRPFAVCHSFDAAEQHTRNPAEVTCPACLKLWPRKDLRYLRPDTKGGTG